MKYMLGVIFGFLLIAGFILFRESFGLFWVCLGGVLFVGLIAFQAMPSSAFDPPNPNKKYKK